MPFHERDPWREQYFEGVACPADVNIPTDDTDSWDWYPKHRWIYEKLNIAKSQMLACGTAANPPQHFPVFAKPNINLKGMGLGSGIIRSRVDFDKHMTPGMMWMPLFEGEHVSTDMAVENGVCRWLRHALGIPWHDGMFTHWVIESSQRIDLNRSLQDWVHQNMVGYTGMLNVETIGGRIIEVHLRFADQWCDLYGPGWAEAVVGLYAHGTWDFDHEQIHTGYSVPLFARHGQVPKHPPAAKQEEIRALPGISSLQITFHELKPGHQHPMPPGGFRLGVINCTDLDAGKHARRMLARCFDSCDIMLPPDG